MDLLLRYDEEKGYADLVFENGEFLQDGGLETACLISLLTEARALEDDLLPDPERGRSGWWGDSPGLADVPGDSTGSREWLLDREYVQGGGEQLAARIKEYTEEALKWLVDDGVAERVEVTVERSHDPPRHFVRSIQVFRPGEKEPAFKFKQEWDAQLEK
ncbi:MAG: phage GP46 family protein [Bdellovibrionota bacterium]